MTHYWNAASDLESEERNCALYSGHSFSGSAEQAEGSVLIVPLKSTVLETGLLWGEGQ